MEDPLHKGFIDGQIRQITILAIKKGSFSREAILEIAEDYFPLDSPVAPCDILTLVRVELQERGITVDI